MKMSVLLLKWGTFKGYENVPPTNEKFHDLLNKYFELGVSISAICQRDTPAQKEILCELVDDFDGIIKNDWSGETLTKEKAKKYIMEYPD
jgi:hypothetical protein